MEGDLAEEVAARVRDADEEERERCANGRVDAVLNGREDGDEDRSGPYDELERGHAPERIYLPGARDQVCDSVNDDSRETSSGDPEERWGEAVQCDDDDDGCQDTRGRGAYTRLRLECRTRERASGRISTKHRADSVGNTDGDEFLVGVNFVAIDTAESYFNINEDNL